MGKQRERCRALGRRSRSGAAAARAKREQITAQLLVSQRGGKTANVSMSAGGGGGGSSSSSGHAAEIAKLQSENAALKATLHELHSGLSAGHAQLARSLSQLVQLAAEEDPAASASTAAAKRSERHVAAYLAFLTQACQIAGSLVVPPLSEAPARPQLGSVKSAAHAPDGKLEWWRRWSARAPQRVGPFRTPGNAAAPAPADANACAAAPSAAGRS